MSYLAIICGMGRVLTRVREIHEGLKKAGAIGKHIPRRDFQNMVMERYGLSYQAIYQMMLLGRAHNYWTFTDARKTDSALSVVTILDGPKSEREAKN